MRHPPVTLEVLRAWVHEMDRTQPVGLRALGDQLASCLRSELKADGVVLNRQTLHAMLAVLMLAYGQACFDNKTPSIEVVGILSALSRIDPMSADEGCEQCGTTGVTLVCCDVCGKALCASCRSPSSHDCD